MTSHNQLYTQALDAITALYEDMSVPASVTEADLRRIIDNIELMLSVTSPLIKDKPIRNEICEVFHCEQTKWRGRYCETHWQRIFPDDYKLLFTDKQHNAPKAEADP